MLTWKPDNKDTIDSWKLAMVLSKGYERILIGSDYDINRVLSQKKKGKLFYDETRAWKSSHIRKTVFRSSSCRHSDVPHPGDKMQRISDLVQLPESASWSLAEKLFFSFSSSSCQLTYN